MKRTSHSRFIATRLGQGFAEYAIILAMVGISALLTITILEPSIGATFSRIAQSEPISPPSLVDYEPQATSTRSTGATPSPAGPTSTPTNTPPPTATITPTAAPAGNCGLTLEAETAVLSGLMRINNNLHPAASGGKYIHVPDGAGDDLSGPNSNSATFTFEITQADTYKFIGYAYADSTESDSFFVEIDGSRILWDVEENTTFKGDHFNDAFGADPVEMALDPGLHTIVVSLREDGTRLDRITLDCNSNPQAPTPTPDPTISCGQVFEAEDAVLTGSMTVGNHSSASGGQYVYSPSNAGDNFSGPNNNSATFTFNVVAAGYYQITGDVYSSSGSQDSFWVTLNGVDSLWDVERNTNYFSDYVNDRDGDDPVTYALTAGTHTVSISLRERETRLDRITIECYGFESPEEEPDSGFLLPADNLCLGANTSQSSTNHGGVSDRACDGDRNGTYAAGSVTHTYSETNPWWEADLGHVNVLQQIKIFNRTDCCSDRLSDFYVFVSDEPFASTDLNTTLASPIVDAFFFEGDIDALVFAFTKQSGRYVRIQSTSSEPLSLAEVEIYGSQDIPASCTAVIDMFYIIDRSGSMDYSISGAANRMAASRSAITTVNNLLIESGLNHRVGAVSYAGGSTYYGGGFTRVNVNNITYPVTADIEDFNSSTLPNINPGGYTPTGPALNDTRLAMIDAWDPLRVPVVILITDGAPNVAQDEILYSASQAANIDVYDSNGDPYPLSSIANFGSLLGGLLRQGNILVDVLSSAEEFMASIPNATIHTIGLGDEGASEFNPQLLQYTAEIGGGNYYAANSASELTEAITAIYNSVPSCEVDS